MGSNQCRFMKWKLCLTNLIDFYDKVTSSVDKGRFQSLLVFSKTFNTVLRTSEIQEIPLRCKENTYLFIYFYFICESCQTLKLVTQIKIFMSN